MATITICDRCKTQPKLGRINEWVEVRYSEGFLAKFQERCNKKIVLCDECYIVLMNFN